MKKFTRETGAILNQNKQIIHWVVGSAAEVLIPQELMWRIHRASPGCVFGFSHIHPPGMTELSSIDKTTLQAWCYAFHPFCFRFITVTEIRLRICYVESTFVGQLESKEDWIKRGKKGTRRFTIELENRRECSHKDGYINLLWRKAYE